MSKLTKLKRWLTVPEAASHLKSVLGEDVTEADVFRLALDDQLPLSVVFVQARPYGAKCEPVDLDAVEYDEVSTIHGASTLRLPRGGTVYVADRDTPIGRHFQLKSDSMVQLQDDHPYDLLLLGGDRLELSHRFWELTDVVAGPPRFMHLEGVFLRDSDSVLQLRLQGESKSGRFFYPPSSLPGSALLVVRTPALLELEASLDGSREHSKPLSTKERSGLLNILGALVELVQTQRAGRDSEAAVIRELIENYGEKHGIGKRNLEQKFAEAKRSLREQ